MSAGTSAAAAAAAADLLGRDVAGLRVERVYVEQKVWIERELFSVCVRNHRSADRVVPTWGRRNRGDFPNASRIRSFVRNSTFATAFKSGMPWRFGNARASKAPSAETVGDDWCGFSRPLRKRRFDAKINPLALDDDGTPMVVGAMMEVDDNASFRHPEWAAINAVSDSSRVPNERESNGDRDRQEVSRWRGSLQRAGWGYWSDGCRWRRRSVATRHDCRGRRSPRESQRHQPDSYFRQAGGGVRGDLLQSECSKPFDRLQLSPDGTMRYRHRRIADRDEKASYRRATLPYRHSLVRTEGRRGPIGWPTYQGSFIFHMELRSPMEFVLSSQRTSASSRTIGDCPMSILIDQDTRVLVQGITGSQSRFDVRYCLEYGTRIVGGVTPGGAEKRRRRPGLQYGCRSDEPPSIRMQR